MTLVYDRPEFSDDEIREIRALCAEKWEALDRQRKSTAPGGAAERSILDRQLRIERLQEKL